MGLVSLSVFRADCLNTQHDPESVHREESPGCKFITGQSDNVPIEKLMKSEQNRLNSFTSRSFDVSVAQRLAKVGFYCPGLVGDTECFSCGLSKPPSFWREGLDPETVHREESPDCEFITGQSDNVPIERWMKYEQNRLNSFHSAWLDVSDAQRLAEAGFYCSVVGKAECLSCGLYKHWSFWQEGHNPETVHREERPNCQFITGHSDNVPIEKLMKSEQNRLDSFDSRCFHVSDAQHLAKSGFFHSGLGDTKCFSCGLTKPWSFWQEGRDPGTVHREKRPNCEFITGQSDNVPIDKSMKSEQNRLDSFGSLWFQLDVSVSQRLAKAGFYGTLGGITKCYSCGLTKPWSFWREGRDPGTVHREERPNCQFITGQSDNVPIERWMKYEQNRLDSFTSQWFDDEQLFVSVRQRLAKAGFYYWGVGNTRCFSCGLYKPRTFWQEGHDPETVHHRESPNCEFITGQSDNVPIERGMKYEHNWLDSFYSCWLPVHQLEASVAPCLAKAGFYCTFGDYTKCFSCGLCKPLFFWREGHDPETVHREERPNCEFITGQSDNVPIDNSNFFTRTSHYIWPFRTNNGETLNNKTTTQQVAAKEQIDNQIESYAQGSIVVSDTDDKQNKISQKTKKEAKFRNPINDVKAESIEESTVAFTFPKPDVENKKAASSSTCQRERFISATRGSCASHDIHSLTASQSSGYRTETVTREEYVSCGNCVTSVGTSERRSPNVSLLNKLHLASFCELSVAFLIFSKQSLK